MRSVGVGHGDGIYAIPDDVKARGRLCRVSAYAERVAVPARWWALAALAVLDMLDRNPDKTLAELKDELPRTWQSPTMSPHCAYEVKYGVAERVTRRIQALQAEGGSIAGQPIRDVVTVNGVRVTCEDGTWGLVRASSNKPELVVVVESPVSEQRMRDMFEAMDQVLRTHPEVGEYNQKI